ncbi:hypothetical protein THAOC_24662, partial [Thalassiosira oceanica]
SPTQQNSSFPGLRPRCLRAPRSSPGWVPPWATGGQRGSKPRDGEASPVHGASPEDGGWTSDRSRDAANDGGSESARGGGMSSSSRSAESRTRTKPRWSSVVAIGAERPVGRTRAKLSRGEISFPIGAGKRRAGSNLPRPRGTGAERGPWISTDHDETVRGHSKLNWTFWGELERHGSRESASKNWAAEPEAGGAVRRRERSAESAQLLPCGAVTLAVQVIHQGAEGWLERGGSRGSGGTQGQPGKKPRLCNYFVMLENS